MITCHPGQWVLYQGERVRVVGTNPADTTKVPIQLADGRMPVVPVAELEETGRKENGI